MAYAMATELVTTVTPGTVTRWGTIWAVVDPPVSSTTLPRGDEPGGLGGDALFLVGVGDGPFGDRGFDGSAVEGHRPAVDAAEEAVAVEGVEVAPDGRDADVE